MRRHVVKALSTPVAPIHRLARPLLIRPPPIRISQFHTSPAARKRRVTDSKANRRGERQVRKEEDLDNGEEWLDSRNPNDTDSMQGKRSTLVTQVDPFDMDEYKRKLREGIQRFKKDGVAIKQGRSDPELIASLKVQLPEQHGGKVPFLDCATVGPKPGDARSLLITVFDPAVPVLSCSSCWILTISTQNTLYGRLQRVIPHSIHSRPRKTTYN